MRRRTAKRGKGRSEGKWGVSLPIGVAGSKHLRTLSSRRGLSLLAKTGGAQEREKKGKFMKGERKKSVGVLREAKILSVSDKGSASSC